MKDSITWEKFNKNEHFRIDIDDCKEDSCKNNGQCVDGVNTFTCDCDGTGFEGDQCQDSKYLLLVAVEEIRNIPNKAILLSFAG